jgi:hypothetical protein
MRPAFSQHLEFLLGYHLIFCFGSQVILQASSWHPASFQRTEPSIFSVRIENRALVSPKGVQGQYGSNPAIGSAANMLTEGKSKKSDA